MKAVKFTLSGKNAFFKKPEVNTYYYFTFGQIHKVVNSLVPMKDRDEGNDWNRILLDRQFLNYPIVLSTHVMLFRTMFGHAKEDVFGFHQLSHSVIILDEIQSYKNELWGEIITFLKGFAELMQMKIIIMSATLPNLDILTDNHWKITVSR